ncbi:MAG: DnaJ domain-containing protein [Planctomycetota bacterium]|nr:DnaJ domain-containing protein [Planctomycetota bacterium]
MAQRDYYKVLGVPRSASADEIKAAHRKLARKHHPDVNKSPDAEKNFAEIQEAYDTLSDPKKRKLYDQFGHTGQPAGAPGAAWSGGAPGAGGAGGFNVEVEDLGSMFDAFFGGKGGRGPAGGPGGFRNAGGTRPGTPHGPRARPRPTPPLEVSLPISFMTAARGGRERVRLTINGKDTSLEVKIPPAVEHGAKLRVRGVDGRSVLLRVEIGGHPLFRRGEGASAGKGLDLSLDLPLTIAEATLGTTVTVPTLDNAVELTIPPGTPSGRKLRLRGKGLTDQTGRAGDLYAVIKIVPPDPATLSDTERKTLEEIAGRSPNPRSDDGWPAAAKAADEG